MMANNTRETASAVINGTTGTTPSPSPASGQASTPTREVAPQEVARWLQAGECVLIDVREPDEHARERIPGARLLPLSKFDPQQAVAVAGAARRVVMHCRSGRRSADACRLSASLERSGIGVYSMSGGIEAWKAQSLPVDVNAGVTKLSVMRQVQLVIGLSVLAGSVLTWFVDPRFVVIPAFFGAGLTFAGATGTCGLAALLAWMPWNRARSGTTSCSTGSCG
jgi:rhodanese-related sulfurtransferase